MRRLLIGLVGMVLLAGCGGDDESVATDDTRGPEAAEVQLEGGGDAGAGSAGAGGGEAVGPPTLGVDGRGVDRVIREGTVVLEVADGGFDAAYDRIVATARDLGGGVQTSDTSTGEDGLLSGALTVRVPAARYEALLTRVGDVGTVLRRTLASEEVTAEFLDLQARQRNLEAQRRFYLDLLTRAERVDAAIAVQEQLGAVTQDLEQVKGRLQFLEERTDFSRLTVQLFEAGASPPELASTPTGFAEFADRAERAFVTVVGGLLILLAALLPLAVLAVVALAAWRLRRPSVATVPAESVPSQGHDGGHVGGHDGGDQGSHEGEREPEHV